MSWPPLEYLLTKKNQYPKDCFSKISVKNREYKINNYRLIKSKSKRGNLQSQHIFKHLYQFVLVSVTLREERALLKNTYSFRHHTISQIRQNMSLPTNKKD